MRVNLTNVLDEGRDQSNKVCIENKRGGKLGLYSICP
jgi:hypothetical protein